MSNTTAAISYAMLLIPMAIAGTVISQGMSKVKKKEPNAHIILGLGIFFLLLVPTMYFLLSYV